MSYKVNVPRKLVGLTVESDPGSLTAEPFKINLKIKFYFIEQVRSWFEENLGEVPTIMISTNDFEPATYWISLPDRGISEAFRVTWY